MSLLDEVLSASIIDRSASRGVRPTQPRKITRAEAGRTIGQLGTAIYGGYIVERDRNPRLTGELKYRTYSEILANTPIVAAGVRLFLNLIAKAQWNVEPALDIRPPTHLVSVGENDLPTEGNTVEQTVTSSPSAVAIANYIREFMHDMETPWPRVTRRAAMYRFYGYSIQEWTAKRRQDGLIGMMDIAPRGQLTIERWDVDITGRVQGVIQRSEQTQEELYLPRNKLIYGVDDSLNDSPEGLGLFRHIAENVQRLRLYEQLEGYSFESDLRGIPVGRAPISELEQAVEAGSISAEERDARLTGMSDFLRKRIKTPSLSMVVDSEPYRSLDADGSPSSTPKWAVDLLQSSSQGHETIAAAIERNNREIARVLGVEQLLLGAGDRGSNALSRDKSHTFGLIVDSTLTELISVFERDFIRPLMELNGWPMELAPKLKTEAIQYRDIEQLTGAIRDLATSGVVLDTNDQAVGELFDLMGLTRPERNMTQFDLETDRAAVLDLIMNGQREEG